MLVFNKNLEFLKLFLIGFFYPLHTYMKTMWYFSAKILTSYLFINSFEDICKCFFFFFFVYKDFNYNLCEFLLLFVNKFTKMTN